MTGFGAMRDKPETPKVGVGVLLCRGDKVLLQRRRGAHGEGEWSLPGGHMELGEDFLGVCRREVLEETGVRIDGVEKAGFVNTVFEEDGLHYVTLFFRAVWDGAQEPRVKEPEFSGGMGWFPLSALPEPLFPPLARFFEEEWTG